MNTSRRTVPATVRPSPGAPSRAARELCALAFASVALQLALLALGGLPLALLAVALPLQLALLALVGALWPDGSRSIGPANAVTLGRAALVALLAAPLAVPGSASAHAGLLATLAAIALLLDGVDGQVARRTGCASPFGARLDMEIDAFLMLVLCALLWQMDKAGAWVLAIGAMRYAFVAAMPFWRWLDAPLPDRFRRKLVCVWQVLTLLVCLAPFVSAALAAPLLALALLLLSASFLQDIVWLHRHRTRCTQPRQEEIP